MPWRQSNILLWFSRSEHCARIIEGLDCEFIVKEFIWSSWCWHINLFIFNRSSTQSCYISIIKCLEANLFVFTDSPVFDRICCPYYEDYFILFIDVVLDNVVVSIIQFSFYPGIVINIMSKETHIWNYKYTIRSIICKASCHLVTRSLSHLVTWLLCHSVTWLLGHFVTSFILSLCII